QTGIVQRQGQTQGPSDHSNCCEKEVQSSPGVGARSGKERQRESTEAHLTSSRWKGRGRRRVQADSARARNSQKELALTAVGDAPTSRVKMGDAQYVVTDDPHYQTLKIRTKWI